MPNSLLWVCLVAIWLFVLVPMVVKSRPRVRKTSDVALSTRVLHRGGRTMAKTRRRMASGRHPHDAEWEPPVREYRKAPTATAVKEADEPDEVTETDVTESETTVEAPKVETVPVMKKVAVEAKADKSEIVDDAEDADDSDLASDEADAEAEVAEVEDDDTDSAIAEAEDADEVVEIEDRDDDVDDLEDEYDDEYDDDAEYDDDLEDDYDDEYDDEAEYDDDFEAEDDVDEEADLVAQDESDHRAGRGGFDPDADRERSDKRYHFRQRVMAALAVLALVGVVAGVLLGTPGWALAVVVGLALVGYMAFLRRAVRNEQRIRQQRMRRLARARSQDQERKARPEVDLRDDIPRRLRRPGAIVLEIDDEDPVFDHLPRFEHVERVRQEPSYRRVVGQ